MSDQDSHSRFEELEAGRVLGDLSAEEIKEWQELSEAHSFDPDFSLELMAAAIETEFVESQSDEIPAELAATLRDDVARFCSPAPPAVITPVWKKLYTSPQTGWGLAAIFALLFVASSITRTYDSGDTGSTAETTELTPEEARDQLLSKAGDLIESDFGGLESYDQMSGKVVWSDELQEGYMTLTDLPANDPTKNQYQLWIVDPDRDEKPVDGGVFDILEGEETAVVRIKNPLLVREPQAFVITLEQPGGVVVSKQETVVAVAKAS